MANLIQVKRSALTAVPTTTTDIVYGELAYSFEGTSNSLFIGNSSNVAVRIAGGKYPWLHNANVTAPGTLVANAVVITDANSFVNELRTPKLTINTSGTTTKYIDTFGITANSTQLGGSAGGSNTEVVSSWAVKTYVDGKTAALGGGITNTQVVFSNSGTLAGSVDYTFNNVTNTVSIGSGGSTAITLSGANGGISTNGYISTTKAVEVLAGGAHLNLTNYTFISTANVDNYAQIAIQNKGNTTTANTSSDVVAYVAGAAVDDTTGFVDMGITANGFNQAAYSITQGSEGYIFSSALSGSLGSGSLVLATDSTGTNNGIRFYVNGFNQAVTSAAMVITSNTNVGIGNNAPAHKLVVGGTMKVNGVATFDANTTLTGAATLSNTVGVTGAATFSNTVAMSGSGANVAGTFRVGGVATLAANAVVGTTSADVLTLNSRVGTSIVPSANISVDLGTSNLRWATVYTQDASVGRDLTVSGNLTVSGTLTTIATTNLTVSDPLIKVANGNASTDILDVGIFGSFGNSTVTSYTGLFRDATDSRYKLFTGNVPEPTTTVDTANVNFAYADLQLGTLFASSLSTANAQITGGSIAGIIDLAVADGGTGQSSFTSNGILFGNNGNALQVTAAGTQGQVLQAGSGGVPAFGTLDGGTF
jgi:hypothetical protein